MDADKSRQIINDAEQLVADQFRQQTDDLGRHRTRYDQTTLQQTLEKLVV